MGLLLLAIPFYIIYHFRLRVMTRFTRAVFRMVIATALMALITFGAVKLDSIVYDIVVMLLLAAFTSVIALQKAHLKISSLMIPVSAGVILALAVVGFYMLFLVFGLKNPFAANIFVPLMGLIAGGMVEADTKALQTYYSGLLHHGQLYNYLIGNGSTHREAVNYFVRQSLQASIISTGRHMSRMVVYSAPMIMLAMVMCGCNVFTAAALQILFYIAVVAASLLSMVIALLIGHKYSFDEYQRLNPVFKKAKAAEKSHEESSASHEEHPDTDSESQQQGV